MILLGFIVSYTFAQNSDEKDTPVTSTFASGYLIDNQTVVIPDVKTLEYAIQHKFGSMDNGLSDFWGIYSPGANVRLGLNYVFAKNFQLGIGQTKKNMYTDINAKWLVLQQTEKNKMPVSLALYGVMGVDGRNANTFGIGRVKHSVADAPRYLISTADRLSYFSQVIVGRKFNDWLSLQAAASFTHYNMVEMGYDHDAVALHFNGRIKFSDQSSFIFNYDQPLKIVSILEQSEWIDDNHSLPNLCFGVEIATYTHAFQIYVGTADGIIPQDVVMNNRNDWTNKGLAIGFTITRLWMF